MQQLTIKQVHDISLVRKTYPPSPPSCEEGGNRICSPFPRRKGGRGDRSSAENENHRRLIGLMSCSKVHDSTVTYGH